VGVEGPIYHICRPDQMKTTRVHISKTMVGVQPQNTESGKSYFL
jgi:hypothetical protein